jgi:release factor glutamine methyltransferase
MHKQVTEPLVEVSGRALWQWWQDARQQAAIAHIPLFEIEWLLREAAGLSRLSLYSGTICNQEQVLLKLPLEELARLWQCRLEDCVPVQYLTGVAPWRQFSLAVSPAVLIPRPETELLIDLAIAATAKTPELRQGHWVDLGTGSGAIALGLSTAFPLATVHAVDCSAEALAIAQTNAQQYSLTDRIRFRQGDWFQPLVSLKGTLSGLISNPPYIPSQTVAELQPEVAKHEPQLALDGGTDGLNSIRHLIDTAPDYLQSGGIWLIEMMADQSQAVATLLHQHGRYQDIQIHKDLAGIERFAQARKKG